LSFLLDTNVISEWVKPQPNPQVTAWLAEVDEDLVFLSVASLAEIRRGVELMPPGKRRDRLAAWLADDLPARFEGRILDIDRRVAEAWGVFVARGQTAGMNVSVLDAFFAATAEVHGLTLVTRNVEHFRSLRGRISDCGALPSSVGPASYLSEHRRQMTGPRFR
jgi:predicted nucleic acid-binding protein